MKVIKIISNLHISTNEKSNFQTYRDKLTCEVRVNVFDIFKEK